MQVVKQLIRSNPTLYRVAKYFRTALVTKKADKKSYVKARLQRSLAKLATVIRDNNLTGGFMTESGEYYIKTNDSIWLYYNYGDDRYTNGDGQNLEFKSSYSAYVLEDFILGYIQDGMCYFDIGANNGYYYSLKIASKYKKCRVYSFEPDPKILYHLRENVVFNGLDNIKVEAIALSDKDGNAYLTADLGSCGFLVVDNALSVQTIEVKCTTLDSYVIKNDVSKIDLIKVDIEGGELNFIKGARTVLEKYRPVLILELSEKLLKRSLTTFDEVKAYFAEYKYSLAKIKISDDFMAIPCEKTFDVINLNNTWLEMK